MFKVIFISLLVLLFSVSCSSIQTDSRSVIKNAIENKQYDEAYDEVEKKAASGDPIYQIVLGTLNYSGIGTAKNDRKALEWTLKGIKKHPLENSSRFKDGVVENMLGKIYLTENNEVPIDYKLAYQWNEKAARKGNAQGFHNLGYMYENGMHVKRNSQTALRNYLEAANLGVVESQARLSEKYRTGDGVTINKDEAFKWALKAANQGHSLSMNNVGVMYDNGHGVRKSLSKAIEWYKKSANAGNSLGQYSLGVSYVRGLGVTKDLDEAQYWLTMSSNQGQLLAKKDLGIVYLLKKDFYQASKYLSEAANKNNPEAQVMLATMYSNGWGYKKDADKAVYWAKKAKKSSLRQTRDTADKILKKHQGFFERLFN